jgi:membrane protease YdiL (CAAX protease family)
MRQNLPKKISLKKVLLLIISYLAIQWLVNLIALSLSAYYLIHSKDSLNKISNFIFSNKPLIYAFSAFILTLLGHLMYPLTQTNFNEVLGLNLQISYFKKIQLIKFYSLFGFFVAFAFVLINLFFGYLNWIGFYIGVDELIISSTQVLFFLISIFFLTTFEEYLFRKIFEPTFSSKFGYSIALILSTLSYITIKWIQFELTWISALNFAILNFLFSKIADHEKTHLASSFFASSLFITLHSIFSLPLNRQDMPGFFILKNLTNKNNLDKYLSGGNLEPESSLILTLLLIAVILFLKNNIRKEQK